MSDYRFRDSEIKAIFEYIGADLRDIISANAIYGKLADDLTADCLEALAPIFESLDLGDYQKVVETRSRLASEARASKLGLPADGEEALDGSPLYPVSK